MDPLQQLIDAYGKLLSEIAGHHFEIINKYDGRQLPYRWEVRTKVEPIRYVATIQLTARDILRMNVPREDERQEYLRNKFGHLFAPSCTAA
jgi:hypothetical protein